ncbi:hypothetical protein C3L33_03416, partial [Rhododendron williamsianum]
MVLQIVLFLVLNLGFQLLGAQNLQVGFYKDKCEDAELIVKEEVEKAFDKDYGIAPGLIRLHFHDSFVRGCDASICIDSTPGNLAEKDGPPNGITLRGFEVIDDAKARLEAECKGVVSCADILSFAARDAVHITGGLYWDVPAGRRDGRISRASETVDLPPPFGDLDLITRAFLKKGLTQREMDPTLDPFYAAQLKQECPRGQGGNVDPNLVVEMNFSPALMDPSYFADVLHQRGLFTSDQTLTTSQQTTDQATLYAGNGLIWQQDFVSAMIKMSEIQVLTGTAGEIRSNCRRINP